MELVSVDVVVEAVVDVVEAVVVVTGSLGANTRGICWIRVLGLLLLGASEAGSSVCSSYPKSGRVGLKLEVETYSLLVVVSVDRGVSSKAAVGVVEMVVVGVAVVTVVVVAMDAFDYYSHLDVYFVCCVFLVLHFLN